MQAAHYALVVALKSAPVDSDFAIARQHLEAAIELSGIHQVKEQKGEFQSSNGYAKFGVKIKMYKYGEPNLYTRFSV